MVRIKLQIFFSIIFILLLLTGCEKNLTGILYSPEYKIACIPKGIGDLYLFDTGRINQRLLVEGLVYQLDWSPTEPKLIYSIMADDPSVYHADLFVFNLQNNRKKLLADEEGYKNNPIFSPDGKSILYLNVNFTTHERKLALMNADGSDKRVIFTQVPGEEVIYYYWSDIPDHLVFSQYDPSEQIGKLYLFNINTHLMQFVIAPEFSGSMFQTVDGNKFYYRFDDQANKISGINRVNITEQAVDRIVTFSVPDWNGSFNVLPDGSKIVLSVSSIRQNAWVRDLYQVNTDGSNLEQLTESTGVDDLYDDPAYLPDGSQIIFIHSTVSEREMWELNPANGEITHITESNPFTGGSYLFKISSVKL
jgi:Tol biopolymer transport system component